MGKIRALPRENSDALQQSCARSYRRLSVDNRSLRNCDAADAVCRQPRLQSDAVASLNAALWMNVILGPFLWKI
jgi:hypothetical protein